MPASVTIESELVRQASASMRTMERPSSESDAFRALLEHCGVQLEQAAESLAQRWEEQSRTVELRENDDQARADRVDMGAALVRALGRALVSDAGTSEDAISMGLVYGADAFSQDASLHHMLKGLDLLEAMVLFATEADLASRRWEGLGLAAGVQLARRLRRFLSLAIMAAAKGYTQAASDEMRDRFRRLRHDLRNPLGTIKSVLTLMDDQSVPEDARAHPRFRVMASRNAHTLDDLIAARLSDVQAMLPSLARQRVSLRTIACGVRRELRAEADTRGVTVVIDADTTRVRVDAIGLELLLHELLHGALREAEEGVELHIVFGPIERTRITVRLESGAKESPIRDARALSRLTALATRVGAALRHSDAIVLELPVHDLESDISIVVAPPADVAVDAASTELGAGKSRYDIGSASERDDRQPRVE
jgi:K+-sensing histidine kinase KdpD